MAFHPDMQTLLIVGPSPAQNATVCHCLEQAGFRVLSAGLGQAALNTIRRENIDLVLLEWELPDLTGCVVIRMIRAEERFDRLPIILRGMEMTAADILAGLESGADLCLVEPFHPRLLVARVRSILRR